MMGRRINMRNVPVSKHTSVSKPLRVQLSSIRPVLKIANVARTCTYHPWRSFIFGSSGRTAAWYFPQEPSTTASVTHLDTNETLKKVEIMHWCTI